jgi:hypothetical protein
MDDGKQLKYGQIRGGNQGFPVTVKTTQYFAAAGGKFVKRTGANTNSVTLATQTDTEILGHIETEELNSSDGTEVRLCVNDPTAVYRLPVAAGTFYGYMKGKTCDLIIASGIQKVALNSNSYKQLIIEDGDATNSAWVDVKVNQAVTDAARVGVV